jgi:hypothetical protein
MEDLLMTQSETDQRRGRMNRLMTLTQAIRRTEDSRLKQALQGLLREHVLAQAVSCDSS